jgi:hypothetical protein
MGYVNKWDMLIIILPGILFRQRHTHLADSLRENWTKIGWCWLVGMWKVTGMEIFWDGDGDLDGGLLGD